MAQMCLLFLHHEDELRFEHLQHYERNELESDQEPPDFAAEF